MQFKAEQVGAPEGMSRATLLVPLLVLLLLTFGLIALFSAGYSMSLREPTAAVTRQLFHAPLAILMGWLAWRVSLDHLRELRWPLLWFVFFLLVLARLPGIGRMVNGSWRWIDFGLFRLQPSDLAKIILVILIADHIACWQRRSLPLRGPVFALSSQPPYLFTGSGWADLRDGFLRPLLPLLILCTGIAFGPDLGTIVLCCAVAFSNFTASARAWASRSSHPWRESASPSGGGAGYRPDPTSNRNPARAPRSFDRRSRYRAFSARRPSRMAR
jgi:cell division protein FtsW (lipid II flippase)